MRILKCHINQGDRPRTGDKHATKRQTVDAEI